MGILLVENLRGKVVEFESRARKLQNRAVEYFNLFRQDPISALVIRGDTIDSLCELYDKLRRGVTESFHSDSSVYSFPLKPKKNVYHDDDLLKIIAYLDQIIGFLEGKKQEIIGDTLRSFPVEDKELEILPTTTKLIMLEAIQEYNHFHSYACCCICGLAFESLVKEGCKKFNLPYKGLAKGINALKDVGVVREDLYKSLLDLEKYYRDKISAHVTSEVATDEKARLFLSSLLALAKAIFVQ